MGGRSNEFEAEVCELTDDASDLERERATTDLTLLRDMGVVHWLGDRPDVADSDLLKSRLFSPAWVRGPVYAMFMDRYGKQETLPVFEESPLTARIAYGAGLGMGDGDRHTVALLIQLLERCRLIVKIPAAQEFAPDTWLIPDNLPEPSASMPKRRFHARLLLDFVPDSLMPQLMAKLFHLADSNANRFRTQFQVLWIHRPITLRFEPTTAALRASYEEEDDAGFLEIIKNEVADMLGRNDLRGRPWQVDDHQAAEVDEKRLDDAETVTRFKDELEALLQHGCTVNTKTRSEALSSLIANLRGSDRDLLNEWVAKCAKLYIRKANPSRPNQYVAPMRALVAGVWAAVAANPQPFIGKSGNPLPRGNTLKASAKGWVT
ncbi:MAG: COR domain-containing protein [Planctomycetota bacterium]